MYTSASVHAALDLAVAGANATDIAQRLGIPRTTVRDWVRRQLPKHVRDGIFGTSHCERCGHATHRYDELTEAYVYLLGLYLGDGWISRHRGEVYRLRIVLDARYPGIIESAAAAMQDVRGGVVHVRPRPIRAAPTYPHTGGLGPVCCLSTAPVGSTIAGSSSRLGSHVLSTAGPSSCCAGSSIPTAVASRTPVHIGPGRDTASSRYQTTSGRSSATRAIDWGCTGRKRERRHTSRAGTRGTPRRVHRTEAIGESKIASGRHARPRRYSQPCSSATRTASARLRASSFCIAEER
ncbi:MAG: helix-turn-helix domain-containing protein [Solirubrobacterales bacterium]|nr:helix-turn-helix domain-containing protein [Solirubrobacterales bacterium]